MTMDFEIRPYRPGDEDGILASFNRVFREVCGEGYVDREMPVWHWQFRDNPWGHRISVAIAPDGVVAAHYAAIPVPMATTFGDCIFVQGVDSFTHPDYRQGLKRPGLFVTVAKHCLDRCKADHESWFGYPVIAAERIGKRFLGYERVCVVDYLIRDLSEGDVPAPAGVEVEPVTAVDESVDRLFETAMVPDKGCLVRRSAAYLRWRYLEAPGRPYEVFAARRAGELVGLMVLRVEHELVPGACTVADWVAGGADREVHAALANAACRRAREAGRERVLVVLPENSVEHRSLRDLGFRVAPSADYMERPLIIGLAHPRMTVDWLAEHWWYTLGDTDLV